VRSRPIRVEHQPSTLCAVGFSERPGLEAVAPKEEPPSALPRAVRILCEVDADAKNSNRRENPGRGGHHRARGRTDVPEGRR
jgi:hypothetical protein